MFETLRSIRKLWLPMVIAGICAGVSITASAGDTLVTRGDTDVNKIYGRSSTGTFASQSTLPLASRNQEAAQADLVRDWNAKPSADAGETVKQRSNTAMHKDLIRDWSAAKPEDKRQAAYSNQ
jgi:hypothetical protein